MSVEVSEEELEFRRLLCINDGLRQYILELMKEGGNFSVGIDVPVAFMKTEHYEINKDNYELIKQFLIKIARV